MELDCLVQLEAYPIARLLARQHSRCTRRFGKLLQALLSYCTSSRAPPNAGVAKTRLRYDLGHSGNIVLVFVHY